MPLLEELPGLVSRRARFSARPRVNVKSIA